MRRPDSDPGNRCICQANRGKIGRTGGPPRHLAFQRRMRIHPSNRRQPRLHGPQRGQSKSHHVARTGSMGNHRRFGSCGAPVEYRSGCRSGASPSCRSVKTIYFDYNATTPLDPAIRQAMLPFLDDIYGNASSVHHVGRKARALLDDARDRVATAWRCKPSEVVFTSGGTESNNLAIFGSARALRNKGRHLITSTIEHHAVLHCFQYLEKYDGFEVTYLAADDEGFVSPEDLKKALRPDTVLVSIMAANNETGAVLPTSEYGEICRSNGVLFHTDAVQVFGKLPFKDIQQFNAGLVSFCSHK